MNFEFVGERGKVRMDENANSEIYTAPIAMHRRGQPVCNTKV